MMHWLFPPANDLQRESGTQASSTFMEKITRFKKRNAQQAELDVYLDIYHAPLNPVRSWTRLALYCIALVLLSFFVWAALAPLDVVTSGTGKVIPTSREQVIQSIEPGVLAELLVNEGDAVEQGQALLRIDDVRLGATVLENQSKVDALRLAAIRLRAETTGSEFVFPDDIVKRNPVMAKSEIGTYEARRRAMSSSIGSQKKSLQLAQEELGITEPMAAKGLVSELDVMRIQRSIVEAKGRIDEISSKYRTDAAAELARVEAELGSQSATLVGKEDSLKRTVLKAPKRGIVKNIRVNTIGGVIQSGQDLLEIVPVDDRLLIETRIRPADIAFLRPGLAAIVKISAYDSGVYGWLEGSVLQISADTLRDEVRRDETYYRALVMTNSASLKTQDGKSLPIIPGMLAQVDIKTGQKTVLAYLFKPVLRAREALRER